MHISPILTASEYLAKLLNRINRAAVWAGAIASMDGQKKAVQEASSWAGCIRGTMQTGGQCSSDFQDLPVRLNLTDLVCTR